MARRWMKIGAGAAIGVTTIVGLFLFLVATYGFQINDLSGNITCLGTYDDPCVSYFDVINPTNKYIDIYSKDQVKLNFSKNIRDYALFVKDGRCSATGLCACILDNGEKLGFKGWRCTDFTNATKSRRDVVYNFRFPVYSNTHFLLAGIKNNPAKDVEWGFGMNENSINSVWLADEDKYSCGTSMANGIKYDYCYINGKYKL